MADYATPASIQEEVLTFQVSFPTPEQILRFHASQEAANGVLNSFGKDGQRVKRRVTQRLRTKVRLYEEFKGRVRGE